MRKPEYSVACTVDGFIAAEDGSTDAFVNDRAYFSELARAEAWGERIRAENVIGCPVELVERGCG